MKKILLSFSVVLFSQFLTAQTIYIQETDMYGRPYVISYPINVNTPSFIRTYDRTGYEMYYSEDQFKIEENKYVPKESRPVTGFNPSDIDLKAIMRDMEYPSNKPR